VSEQPLVWVTTPVYNGERFLAECIESVLAQTYENWQYTIVDNCSSDGTAQIVRDYAARDKAESSFRSSRTGTGRCA
jgi:glycosyltransferase involved in cell wall biosynthesis